MREQRIADYGVIGDGSSAALIARDGSIDWLCLPYLDSPSVFAALLDEARGGRFALRPVASAPGVQRYLEGTNVLETSFRTDGGELQVLDFLPADGRPVRVLRRAKAISGKIELHIECRARFDYARCAPRWSGLSPCAAALRADGHVYAVCSSRPLEWRDECATISLAAGESLWLGIAEGSGAPDTLDEVALERSLAATCAYWRRWIALGREKRLPDCGAWEPALERSALVLKLLQMRETGSISAAATTSLPAIIGGERNWDYRFSWIRDASMTVATLFRLGHHPEATAYLQWLRSLCVACGCTELKILYRLREPVAPDDEAVLSHLAGHRGSAPVRVGQGVVHQRQHDIYGELLDTLFVVSHYTGKLAPEDWDLFRPLVGEVVRIWREPDDGIWEARIGAKHYTHSKLMCWVALDRGIKIAEHYGFAADLEHWRTERDAIRADILARGYDSARGRFRQHYESGEVDAALLLIPLTGFLPASDARVAATVRAIEEELLRDGVLRRYVAADGLDGQEEGFLICLFWYVECLILQGRLDEARRHLREATRYASPLGLFGEQYDPGSDEITGNYPQAYSHIGYVSAVLKLVEAERPAPQATPPGVLRKLALLWRRELLNPADAGQRAAPEGSPAGHLKQVLNMLHGHFYDGHAQRVDYDRIRGSRYYDGFRAAAASLADFDVASLATDAERIAFWVNLYNAIVVHGVIHLGIRASVREVPRFFDRIAYVVGGLEYTADDIEHGILRGNAVPPGSLRRAFSRNDPRRAHVVERPDPRIHFALVCASKTCPPIEVYSADVLDGQLETSGRVFVNATTRFDRESRTLWVSEIFKWYRSDFGRSDRALAGYLAGFLYDAGVRAALERDTGVLTLAFTPYDWRLNR